MGGRRDEKAGEATAEMGASGRKGRTRAWKNSTPETRIPVREPKRASRYPQEALLATWPALKDAFRWRLGSPTVFCCFVGFACSPSGPIGETSSKAGQVGEDATAGEHHRALHQRCGQSDEPGTHEHSAAFPKRRKKPRQDANRAPKLPSSSSPPRQGAQMASRASRSRLDERPNVLAAMGASGSGTSRFLRRSQTGEPRG